MSITPTGGAEAEAPQDATQGHSQGPLYKLAIGAIGIVFGDIGTSPIYAFRETFAGHHILIPDRLHIYGVLSLIFWSMMIIVTLKYVTIIMRADNKGEGGSLALLALINRTLGGKKKWTSGIILMGVFATALFYGDSMITPAISVLSAVEGLTTVNAGLEPFVIPIAVAILIGLFAIQARGTAKVGLLFGPVMLFYFAVLAVLGVMHIMNYPAVITAMINPINAFDFFAADFLRAFIAMGSVVLAVTGAEALYADMGHFGRVPIRVSWLYFVLPALLLNYMGQGAMILSADPSDALAKVKDPFFYLAPDMLRLPLVLLATAATIIASQAVISGAFSVTQQAIQLGFIPRLRITHTSESAAGQIYIPVINWALMIMVILLVLTFRNSSNLAAAYGIAVTGAMLIDSVLIAVVLRNMWNWNRWLVIGLLVLFFTVDGTYLSANLLKIPAGGWFPLLVGAIAFTLLTTWAKGRQLMITRMNEASLPMEIFIKSAAPSAARVPGTAVFMTSSASGVPHALLHNLKHNKVLHERVILLTVRIEDVPYVTEEKRLETKDYGAGFFRVVLRYGFMEEVDVPAALAQLKTIGPQCKMMDTSFFLARQTLLASSRPGMAIWREKLFAWMLRNAESAMEFFKLPTNRVVELGSQVENLSALIVTVELAPRDFGWLEGLRRAHYPPDRNQVPAHLTMFRALPPSAEAEVRRRLAGVARGPPPNAAIESLMDLGGGVAFRIVSPSLDRIRENLAADLHGLLGAQDSAGWRPHVTIQNKVAPKFARALKVSLEGSFVPKLLSVSGLGLYRYLGGPWERLGVYAFRGT